ncbi:MAG TPA: alpha/beta hydrolase domain-containing protein, partial [Bryobacterales bacterium]|nr:alpha/beta hydrolase domain-containing protein [Bryobacterales bacterium]
YWGRAASLIHTSIDGRSDARIPENVRIYMFAGGQHGPAAFPPTRTIGQQLNNPNDYRWAMRALLVAMDRWVTAGAAPPPSAYPQIAKDSLVTPQAVQFPRIPGVNFPTIIHKAYRVDYGPQWKAGIIGFEPPKVGAPFPILVSQVDLDGNEIGGLKMPEVAVPLATYTGWNLFDGKAGPSDELASMQGSYIPFPRTRAERERNHDPRRSIEERYYDRSEYMGEVSDAALRLIEQGYVLDRDLPAILEQANVRWKRATGQ